MNRFAEVALARAPRTSPAARTSRRAPNVLVGVAMVATGVAVWAATGPARAPMLGGYVRVDATSRLFLAVVNPIFLGISLYIWNRIAAVPSLGRGAARFTALAVAFLAAANLVLVGNHFMLLLLALEATTLAAAPLIARAGVRASQVASWRYLLFSSVGLGLVLLGLVCLTRGMESDGQEPTLFVDCVPTVVRGVANVWTKLGLGLVLLGLGTKLGLAPMYSWLPETYDEAPPAVTALLAAVQFNCAVVVLFRVLQVFRPGNATIVTGGLVGMGCISMLVSTLSLIATRNLKRLIAYASINHAGVIAIGLGVGKAASYGLLLYVISNAFIKAILFLTAGQIKAHYRTKDTRKISGLIEHLPYSGIFLMVGTFALLGFPPFGSFLGELLILSALVSSKQLLVFAAFCILITMSFVATGRTIFPMIWSESREAHDWRRQTLVSALPKISFLVILVALGIYIPDFVNGLIRQVAASLGEQ